MLKSATSFQSYTGVFVLKEGGEHIQVTVVFKMIWQSHITEPPDVPKFGEGTSSTAEARQIELPKVPIAEPAEAPKMVPKPRKRQPKNQS